MAYWVYHFRASHLPTLHRNRRNFWIYHFTVLPIYRLCMFTSPISPSENGAAGLPVYHFNAHARFCRQLVRKPVALRVLPFRAYEFTDFNVNRRAYWTYHFTYFNALCRPTSPISPSANGHSGFPFAILPF